MKDLYFMIEIITSFGALLASCLLILTLQKREVTPRHARMYALGALIMSATALTFGYSWLLEGLGTLRGMAVLSIFIGMALMLIVVVLHRFRLPIGSEYPGGLRGTTVRLAYFAFIAFLAYILLLAIA